jgi:hypothetical protein
MLMQVTIEYQYPGGEWQSGEGFPSVEQALGQLGEGADSLHYRLRIEEEGTKYQVWWQDRAGRNSVSETVHYSYDEAWHIARMQNMRGADWLFYVRAVTTEPSVRYVNLRCVPARWEVADA